MRLNEEVEIIPPKDLDNYKPPCQPLFTAACCFSLLEVLDAIFDDISFYGGPAEAQDFIEEMNETKAAYDRGEIETVPLDELGTERDEP